MKKLFTLFFAIAVVSVSTSQNSNYIYEVGTLWHSGFYNILNSNDTDVFSNSTYKHVASALMWDRLANNGNGAWTNPDSWIYDITYNDGVQAEIRIRQADYSKSEADAAVARYTPYLGRLPYVLRNGIKLINIMKAEANFGGNNWNNSIDIYEGSLSTNLINGGNMEEMLLHEGTHSALDYLYNENWKTERDKDPKFISKYAYDNPDREDISETFAAWMALRNTNNRLSQQDKDALTANLSHRIAYLNSLNFNLFPIVATSLSVKSYSAEKVVLFPNPSHDELQIRSEANLSAYVIYDALGAKKQEGLIDGTKRIPIRKLSRGTYFLRLNNKQIVKFIKN